jgi:two-component system response regulator
MKPVLLVEDNPDDAALTLRAFRRNHIANEIIVAEDGVEALDYLHARGKWTGRDRDELPLLILLDLKLPRKTGIEVLRELRSDPRTRYVPVVVLTSSDEQRDLVESYGLGANGYVRKPVEFAAFVEATRAIGTYWLLLNETPADIPLEQLETTSR